MQATENTIWGRLCYRPSVTKICLSVICFMLNILFDRSSMQCLRGSFELLVIGTLYKALLFVRTRIDRQFKLYAHAHKLTKYRLKLLQE